MLMSMGCNNTITRFLGDSPASTMAGGVKRRKITINNSAQAENLVNFPLMVRLDSTRISYAAMQSAGQDLRFYDSDGTTQLSHEIELWNASGNSYAWVKVPQIDAASASDFIWMQYGDASLTDGQSATNTWSNFQAVLHLKAGSYADSTAAANNGTNTASTDVSGKVGGGKSFNGTSSNITVSTSGLSASQGTFEAWAYPTAAPGVGANVYVLAHKSGACSNNDRMYLLITNDNPPTTAMYTGIGNLTSGTATSGVLTLSAWNFLALTWNNGTYHVYLNGSEVTLGGTSYTNFTTLETFYTIGAYECGGNYFTGYIDEVRASTAARSAAWIAAQYKSMNDDYLAFSAEQ